MKKTVVNRNNNSAAPLVNGSMLISNATVAARGMPKNGPIARYTIDVKTIPNNGCTRSASSLASSLTNETAATARTGRPTTVMTNPAIAAQKDVPDWIPRVGG